MTPRPDVPAPPYPLNDATFLSPRTDLIPDTRVATYIRRPQRTLASSSDTDTDTTTLTMDSSTSTTPQQALQDTARDAVKTVSRQSSVGGR